MMTNTKPDRGSVEMNARSARARAFAWKACPIEST